MPRDSSFFEFGGNQYLVHYSDCRDMSSIKDERIQLIMTSPPYFDLKDYSSLPRKQRNQMPHSSRESRLSYKDYLLFLLDAWKECRRVLSPTGAMLVNVDVIKFRSADRNIIPLPFHIIQQFDELGMGCKDIWIYKKLTGVPFQYGRKLKNRHEYLLVFSKSNEYKWNLDDVRVPYSIDYIYPPGHKRRNPIGQAPSSVWEFYPPFQTGNQHYHYCPFPDEMVDRAIKLFTDENDWVLDPFLGSGKVVARSKALRRSAVGYEVNPEFKTTIDRMVEDTEYGSGLGLKNSGRHSLDRFQTGDV